MYKIEVIYLNKGTRLYSISRLGKLIILTKNKRIAEEYELINFSLRSS
jgi:hypothetical protein